MIPSDTQTTENPAASGGATDPKRFLKVFFLAFGAVILAGAIVVGIVFGVSGRLDSADGLVKRGAAALEAGKIDDAVRYYGMAVSKNGDLVEARIGLCAAYEAKEDYVSLNTAATQGLSHSPATYEFYSYKMKALVLRDDLDAARAFLKTIDNAYVTLKVNHNSPGDLSFSPQPGVFGEPTQVTITCPSEKTTIYYTTDGTAPTVHSPVYDKPLEVKNGAFQLRCFAMTEAGFITEEYNVLYTVRDESAVYSFADKGVSQHVCRILGVSSPTALTYGMLDRLTEFVVTPSEENPTTPIESLDDLKNFVNLQTVVLWNETGVKDYSPLSSIPSLTSLSLINAQLTNKQLAGIAECASLTSLTIDGNLLTDLSPLNKLTGLQTLSAQGNQLRQPGTLARLTQLGSLNLSRNQISDLRALSALSGLRELVMQENSIASLSGISSLSSLTRLDLSKNPLTALTGISNLGSLNLLVVADCRISDISGLEGSNALLTLDLSGNPISNFAPLRTIPITTLRVANCGITSLSEICSVRTLQTLDLSGNAGLTKLNDISLLPTITDLDISRTGVTSVATLNGCASLRRLTVQGLNLRDLARLTNANLEIIS